MAHSVRAAGLQAPASRCPTGLLRRNSQAAPQRRHTLLRRSAAAQDEAASVRIKEVRQEVTRRVKTLGEANRPKDAVRELAEMARMGVQPDLMAATALTHACARNGKMEMAQSVFDELFGTILEPDAVSYTVLVRGYGAEDPPRWGTIANLLSSMVKDHSLSLTTEVYNAMLEICSRTNDIERGIEIMDRMNVEGVQSDEFTLTMVSRRKALRSHYKKVFGN